MSAQLPELPHVKVDVRDGRVCVNVFDWELYDYLDDFFAEECDLACDHVHAEREAPPRYCLLLPSSLSIERAAATVAKLDPSELERIFRINNP